MLRRFWRYGQQHAVNVEMVYSTGEAAIADNLKRKETESHEMFAAMASHMSGITTAIIKGVKANVTDYVPNQQMELPEWLRVSTSTPDSDSQCSTEIAAK